jgi:hypothetical protein
MRRENVYVLLWRFRFSPSVRHVRIVADRVPFEHDAYGSASQQAITNSALCSNIYCDPAVIDMAGVSLNIFGLSFVRGSRYRPAVIVTLQAGWPCFDSL